ncbi:thymidine phosphorylase, partial [candidate division WOR-3 bacterium]|nr:thymidine phosphorylase [candidate division WOR-3 bacterium]
RDREKLSEDEIKYFVNSVKSRTIKEYQISALLMAIYFRGMDFNETFFLTKYMIGSGVKIDLSDIPGKKIDKHSTGGVGDKVSLIVAPVAAYLGITVPMISGRGLGHTGGTVDKMNAIEGYKTGLNDSEFKQILKNAGCAIISQTENIAPVDRVLYAIRDVTGTVESIPLITSSIMSKKLSEDLDGLVIDLKVGKGAFMKNMDSAKKLAEYMMGVSERLGVKIKIYFTSMDSPLGRAVGNGPEVLEAIDVLKGGGPEDVVEVASALADGMIGLAGIKRDVRKVLKSKKAYERFSEMVKMQGGNINNIAIDQNTYEINSERGGIVQSIDAYKIGMAAVLAGAGRVRKEDDVDYGAGIYILKKEGEEIKKNEPLAIVYTKKYSELLKRQIIDSFEIKNKEPERKSRIIEIW